MRFEGRIRRAGRYWAIEVPILGVFTQGRTKKEAFEMIADAVESLVNKGGFQVRIFPGSGDHFEIESRARSREDGRVGDRSAMRKRMPSR